MEWALWCKCVCVVCRALQPLASITTWHVWVFLDCISDQQHQQEKTFAPDEWSGSCGANVCVWETELSKACGSCSKEKTLVFCWWWHSFSSQVGMCGLFLTASMISGNNRQIMQSMECRAQSVKKCIKAHKRMWKDCADVASTAAAQMQHSH